jgi:hypothetical protein
VISTKTFHHRVLGKKAPLLPSICMYVCMYVCMYGAGLSLSSGFIAKIKCRDRDHPRVRRWGASPGLAEFR